MMLFVISGYADVYAAKVTKQTESRVYSERNNEELETSVTLYTYSKGKLSREDVTYNRYMITEDSARLSETVKCWTKYKYKKGRLKSVTRKDSFGYIERENYAYKGKKKSKAVYYKKSKKTGKYVKKKITTFKYGKNKLTKICRSPKGTSLNKEVFLYDKKGRKKSRRLYLYGEEESYTLYRYYKSGELKTKIAGDEYGAFIYTYDKNGLLISEKSEDYCTEESNEYSYVYSDLYKDDVRYPQTVLKYHGNSLVEREARIYRDL